MGESMRGRARARCRDGISMVQRKHKVINWNNSRMRNDVFPFAPLNGTFALAANFPLRI